VVKWQNKKNILDSEFRELDCGNIYASCLYNLSVNFSMSLARALMIIFHLNWVSYFIYWLFGSVSDAELKGLGVAHLIKANHYIFLTDHMSQMMRSSVFSVRAHAFSPYDDALFQNGHQMTTQHYTGCTKKVGHYVWRLTSAFIIKMPEPFPLLIIFIHRHHGSNNKQ